MGDLYFLLGSQRLSFPLVACADAQPPPGLLLDGALAFGQMDYRRDVRLPEEMPRFSLVLAGGAMLPAAGAASESQDLCPAETCSGAHALLG